MYTDSHENSYIKTDDQENSVLAIVAKDHGGGEYSSAVNYQRPAELSFGRIEARVKIPTGQGIWPAFWMLGESHETVGWPGSGEIDILKFWVMSILFIAAPTG